MSEKAQRINRNECPNCGRSCLDSPCLNSFLCRYCYDSYIKGYVAAKEELEIYMPRWVSVEEELPPNKGYYWTLPSHLAPACFSQSRWGGGDKHDWETKGEIVTHWLKFKMPEAPERSTTLTELEND